MRPLTTLEKSLIRTFPANYKWTGSKTDREQMVGNAVPVNLGKYVAEALKQYVNPAPIAPSADVRECFRHWLVAEKGLSKRSASNVISRLNRANEIKGLEKADSESSYLACLSEDEAYKALNVSVKSQIKGAVKRYYSFCRFNYKHLRNSD